jgi:hypothetical protein
MTATQAPPRPSCHDRHDAASQLVRLTKRPKLSDTLAVRFAKLLRPTNWQTITCGHFSVWWTEAISEKLKWAESATEPYLLSEIIEHWFQLTWDMVRQPEAYCPTRRMQGSPIDCPKARVYSEAEWVRHFQECLEAGPCVRQTLAGCLSAHLHELHDNDHSSLECAKAIAKYAVDEDGIRPIFLGLAALWGQAYPPRAIELLDEVLKVVACAPVDLLEYLGKYVRTIPYKGNESRLKEVHNKVDKWVTEQEAKGNSNNVAYMRDAQEHFEPHLRGGPPRLRHKAGNKAITVTVIRTWASEPPTISGHLVDVTQGGQDINGRAIQVGTDKWQFGPVGEVVKRRIGNREYSCYKIKAIRMADKHEVEFDAPTIELTWPGGKLSGDCYSLRGFPYKPEYNIPGGGVVLIIDKSPDMGAWQGYVTKQLSEVDYGRIKP